MVKETSSDAAPGPARTFPELVAVDPVTSSSSSDFVSRHHPIRMGNTLPIAYGGGTLAAAVGSAMATVKSPGGGDRSKKPAAPAPAPAPALYSVTGHFLGPAFSDRRLWCRVERVRDTRTFATRRVVVRQRTRAGEDEAVLAGMRAAAKAKADNQGLWTKKKEKDGEEDQDLLNFDDDKSWRACMSLQADFHVREPSHPRLEYSAPPAGPSTNTTEDWPPPGACLSVMDQAAELHKHGKITAGTLAGYRAAFGDGERFAETRYCPGGIAERTLGGVVVGTEALGAPPASKGEVEARAAELTGRVTAEYLRSRHAVPTSSSSGSASSSSAAGEEGFLDPDTSQTAILAFLMDGGLSFVPLVHDNAMWLDSVAACSTLDFALRVFAPPEELRMGAWYLRERRTQWGGWGKTYAEGRLWDDGDRDKGGDGDSDMGQRRRERRLVASMTQVGIMRPKKEDVVGGGGVAKGKL